MRIREINKMIQDAVKDEQQTSRLANTVRTVARNNGANPSEQQVAETVAFVLDYVQHVPFYLEQGIAGAGQVGLVREMNQMVSELEAYWFERFDFIPDQHGLLGIMDDAYVSLALLQSVSDFCQGTKGRPLLAHDITPANQVIRHLIGEPVASQIDQHVAMKLTQSLMQHLANQFAVGNLQIGLNDPFWQGQALQDYELDQIVNTRLGAMGIV